MSSDFDRFVGKIVAYKPTASKTLSVGSLFAGVGGIDLGFQKSGFRLDWANEIDENACQTYQENFRHKIVCDDIKNLETNKFSADVLVAGFPCQAFSIAGYRKGLKDKNGAVYFDLVKVISDVKPKAIFLENVKNLLSHNNGKTIGIVRQSLEQLGYHARYEVLNTHRYSHLPQNRERLYIVAFLDREHAEEFAFDLKEKQNKPISSFLDPTVPDRYYYCYSRYKNILEKEVKKRDTFYQWRRQYVRENKSNLCPTLTANMGTGGHNVPLIKTASGRIRKLTPRECFRLQGFPEEYVLPDLADSKLYKQAGNSVSVPVVEQIAKRIMRVMNG